MLNRCRHFVDGRSNLVGFRTLLLNRLAGFIRHPAEFFSRRSHLVGGRADLTDGVLNLDDEVVEAAAQNGQLIFTIFRQALAQVALTVGNLPHHVADLVQRRSHGAANDQPDYQRNHHHHNGQQ